MSMICYVDTPKGGAGKSTTSMCLASALADRGRVLLASLSKQNEVISLLQGKHGHSNGLRDVALHNEPPKFLRGGRVDVLPAGSTSSPSEDFDEPEAAQRLRAALELDSHDYVVVDGAQMSDAICLAMVRSCDILIVPVNCDRFSARAAFSMMIYVNGIPKQQQPDIRVLFTQVWARSARSVSEARLYKQLREEWGAIAFRQEIRYSRAKNTDDWSKHTSQQIDAALVRPTGIIAEDHDLLASELINYYISDSEPRVMTQQGET